MDDRYWKVKSLVRAIDESSIPHLQSVILQTKLVEIRRMLLRYPPSTKTQQEHAPFYEFLNQAMQLSQDGYNTSLYQEVMDSAASFLAQMNDEEESAYP